MRTRVLGRTDLRLPVLSFGASPLGGVFGPVDPKSARAAVGRALARGMNYFDTSPFYGATESERMLGRCLKDIPRARYILSTKVGRYGQREFDFSAARVRASLRESQDRLGVDFFDIVFCHDIEFGDPDQIVAETLPALREARDAGLLRYTGISGLPLGLLRDVAERGGPDVVLTYCRYALFNTDLVRYLGFYAERGIGLINAAPLGMGLLTREGPPDWHPASPALREACREAARLCELSGFDLAELALDFALAGPAATVLVGMRDAESVERNAARVEAAVPDMLDEIRELFQNLPLADRIWDDSDQASQL